jgi:succinyl-diaminopimelate desuccinylase
MKGAIAAFVAAAAQLPERGTISLIITGDEEGAATHGTVALIEHLRQAGEQPDLCLVGEPTSVHRLGDMAKIGRRGSVNIWIEVAGKEGHVAYPHLADNPIPRLVALLAELQALTLDEGTDWFQPSNLEITDIAVGNPATNVIPPKARANFNIRFNDHHTQETLKALVEQRLAAVCGNRIRAHIDWLPSNADVFVTKPGTFTDVVSGAVAEVTGRTPALSTSGGTSDARFIKDYCPVVEFGLVGQTMHQIDERVPTAELETLTAVYRQVIETVFERL